jgi:hypothetical protein
MLVLGSYWLPSILGYYRRQPDLFSVVVVNALLGWTMAGWVILAKTLRPASSPQLVTGRRRLAWIRPRRARCQIAQRPTPGEPLRASRPAQTGADVDAGLAMCHL